MSDIFLGVDIGGSSIKGGLLADDGDVLCANESPLSLEQGLEANLESLFEFIGDLCTKVGIQPAQIAAAGVAAPGTMDTRVGIIFKAFNLSGWNNLPLARIVASRLGVPAFLVNDANAAAFGEYSFGTAREASSLFMWTLGTGIGGGIILDGRIWTGAHDHAAESGQMIIQMDGGPQSPFGVHGAVELFSGGRAIVDRCRSAMAATNDSVFPSMLESDEILTPLLIAEAANRGSEEAEQLIMETARALGVATVSVIHLLNPEMILLGGAMTFGRTETPLGCRFLAKLQEVIDQRGLPIPARKTILNYASLGNRAGLIGAARYAQDRCEQNKKQRALTAADQRLNAATVAS